jgi:hypothetical protein
MSIGESFDDFLIHTVPSTVLDVYLHGESVRSSTTHEQIRRPPLHNLYAMQHEHHYNAGYIVRLIWRRP